MGISIYYFIIYLLESLIDNAKTVCENKTGIYFITGQIFFTLLMVIFGLFLSVKLSEIIK